MSLATLIRLTSRPTRLFRKRSPSPLAPTPRNSTWGAPPDFSFALSSSASSAGLATGGLLTQGRSVLSSLMGRRGFPPAKMSESIGDNPNRRLSHAGIAAGGFAHHPRPSSRRRQAVRSGHGVAVRRSQHGRRGQLLPANA